MKNSIFITTIILLATLRGEAQNIPVPYIPPSSLPGQVAYPQNFGQPEKYNYTRVYIPLTHRKTLPSFADSKDSSIVVSTTYEDGWGRPIINILRNNTSKDVVTPYSYRSMDTAISYLPYPDSFDSKFVNDIFTRQYNYYKNPTTNADGCAYAKHIAKTPSGVPTTKTYAPGLEMVGQNRGGTVTEDYNAANEILRLKESDYNSGTDQFCHSSAYYPAKRLEVSRSEGHHGEVRVTYTDLAGKLICEKTKGDATTGAGEWLTTYYVYNDLEQLVMILPPKACMNFGTTNCISNAGDLLFFYKYDDMGNLIEKHVPGKEGVERAVYNRYGQLVMSTSPNMEDKDEWMFTIYDKRERAVMTGIYTGTETHSYWQGIAMGTTTPVTHYYPNSAAVPATSTLEYFLENNYSGTQYPDSLFGCEIHTYNYYDNYSSAPANLHGFAGNYSQHYLTGLGMEEPTPYMFAHGKLVASKVRILDRDVANNFTNTPWITSIYFYDEKDRMIQVQTQNPWNKWDTVTIQYNFKNQPVLNMASYHAWDALNKPSTKIFTRYTYGLQTGRLITVDQMTDEDSVWYSIASYDYDELGRVKNKWLGGDGGAKAEEQAFTYNIRGQLTGINENELNNLVNVDYVSYASELAYESGFNTPRYDGALSGYIWQSEGTAEQRAYGYEYDTAGRMKHVEYRDYQNGNWKKNLRDFTVSNLSYDANGNILSMNQRGYDSLLAPGTIDVLDYTYEGNRLMKVTDGGVNSPKIRDFDNGSSGTGNDYQYDLNGNLIADANKDISLIEYDHYDKPTTVVNGNNDSLWNIYDAEGTLLQRMIVEGGDSVIYRYWGPFVFKGDSLQYTYHSEGRTRWQADSSKWKYDFFVRDHQGNVRTVITQHMTQGLQVNATFEMVYANVEESIFEQIAEVRANNPQGVPGDISSGELNGSDPTTRVGAAMLAHVMAGDQLNLKMYGYYESTDNEAMNTYATPEVMMEALITTLASGRTMGGDEDGGSIFTEDVMGNLLSASNYDAYDDIKNNITDPNYPRTYLNYLVFDEEMTLIPEQCQVVQLIGAANGWQLMELGGNVTAKQNGFVLVYATNESHMSVWVDNMHFVTTKSRLLEEQHYYPHGLVVEAGGQYTSPLPNKHLFESNKLMPDLGLELSDFHNRMYDQQIGRFTAIDPLADYGQSHLTPYHFVGNDPANFVDPLGLDPVAGYWAFFRVGGFSGALIPTFVIQEFTVTAKGTVEPTEEAEIGEPGIIYYYYVDTPPSGGGGGNGGGSVGGAGGGAAGGGMKGGGTPMKTEKTKHRPLTYVERKAQQKQEKLDAKIQSEKRGNNRVTPEVRTVNNEKSLPAEMADAVQKGLIIPDAAFTFTQKTNVGRKLATGTAEKTADFVKTVKMAKPLTRGIAVLNVAATTMAVADDWSHGRYRSGIARGVTGVIIGGVTAACPLCGIGLGVLEAAYGDQFYDWLEKL